MTSVYSAGISIGDVESNPWIIKPSTVSHGTFFSFQNYSDSQQKHLLHTRSSRCKVNRLQPPFKMYFSQYLASAILVAVPSIAAGLPPAPWNNIIAPLTTQTVTAYKTYLPTPTVFKRGNATYTVTQKSWVTVTDCPDYCTISFAPGHQQTVAPVSSYTESKPE
jgi:hypothetical protein